MNSNLGDLPSDQSLNTLGGQLLAHVGTVGPNVLHRLKGSPERPGRRLTFETLGMDGNVVRTSGRLHERPGDELVVIVHGLGGKLGSHYVQRGLNRVLELGRSVVLVSRRGADGSGEGIAHAGLTEDLHAALRHPALERFRRIVLLGYSMGGHVVLCASTDEALDRRVVGCGALCPPMDLHASQEVIDAPHNRFYCRYLLRGLKAIYREVAERRRIPTPWQRIEDVRSLREWDALVIVPEFGFDDVDDYYDCASFSGRLGDLRVPAIVVAGAQDPMIPPSTHRGVVEMGNPLLTYVLARGAHVWFPSPTSLGALGAGCTEAKIVTRLLEA